MDISGDWYNELKSKMVLTVDGSALTGTYNTGVGDASGEYSLVGRWDPSGEESQAIGFVVTWQNGSKNTPAVTSWSGQVQTNDQGDEVILTTWLLTEETERDSDWASTTIGQDVFTRQPPAAPIRLLKAAAHPATA
jgi:hypothetical protein